MPITRILSVSLGLALWAAMAAAAQAPPGTLSRSEMERAQESSPGMVLNTQGLPDMDCGTLDILIRHDRYTVGLLRQVLRQAQRPDLKALIEQMIHDHEAEMARLQVLRNTCQGVPPEPE